MTTASDGSPRVGFVGLGRMGWPMAHNLAEEGLDLTVGDADRGVRESFAAEHGCRAAAEPADFGSCDVLVTMLPNDAIVRAVLLDAEGGVAAKLPAGAVVLDMSSSNPTATQDLGAELGKLGLALVDAPVSGGVARAQAGSLSLMVGGDDEDALKRVGPVLEPLAERVFRAGPLGSGHATKALNNYLAASAYASAAEALQMGKALGLDPATLFEVVNASTGRSFVTEHVVGEQVVPGTYSTGFMLELLAKDVGIAADVAETLDLDAPVLSLVRRRWAEAAASASDGADHSEAHLQWWPAEVGSAEGGAR